MDDAGDLDAPAGMSYADWESQRGEVQIPRWMEKSLRIPGGAFCLLLILLPFTLVRSRMVFTLSVAVLLSSEHAAVKSKLEPIEGLMRRTEYACRANGDPFMDHLHVARSAAQPPFAY